MGCFGEKMIRNQSGKAESSAPAVITIIIILILGFLSYKFVPVKWKNMKFKQGVERIVNINYSKEYKTVARGGFNEYTMRDEVLKLAERMRIPIKDSNKEVKVERPEGTVFKVTVDYVEEISLPFYGVYNWRFHVYIEQDPHGGKAID